MNAVDIEAVGVEVFTDLLTGNFGWDGLIASAIGKRLCIINEIPAENVIRDRMLNGSISALISVGHLDGNKRRSAVFGTDADVVFHIRIDHCIAVPDIAVAAGLKHLDCPFKGDVDNGTAVIVIAFKIRVADFILVTLVYLRKFQRVQTLIKHAAKSTRIRLAVLEGGKSLVFIQHAALKGHDPHTLILFFFRRHRNTSFFCDASILPYFATFFKELFVNSGRRNLSFKDFGQRGKGKNQ